MATLQGRPVIVSRVQGAIAQGHPITPQFSARTRADLRLDASTAQQLGLAANQAWLVRCGSMVQLGHAEHMGRVADSVLRLVQRTSAHATWADVLELSRMQGRRLTRPRASRAG